jgi:hypothetical protein
MSDNYGGSLVIGEIVLAAALQRTSGARNVPPMPTAPRGWWQRLSAPGGTCISPRVFDRNNIDLAESGADLIPYELETLLGKIVNRSRYLRQNFLLVVPRGRRDNSCAPFQLRSA